MKASHCVLSVGLLLAVLLGGASLLESEVAAELGVRQEEAAAAVVDEPATLSQVEPNVRRSLATQTDARIAPEALLEKAGAPSAVWELIARLETHAEEPASFHELALPVIAQLGAACTEDEGAPEVLAQVVANEERSDLVRGAVLLGVAAELTQPEFDTTFFGWFGVIEASPELLRAAAIASALRGEKSYCSLPLDLGFLGQLQTAEAPLPNIYPLRIERLPSAPHLDVLRGWIEAAALAASEVEPTAIGDFFVTAEVLFAVWGQAALQVAEIEAVVLAEAFKTEGQRATENTMYLRVANFLVHSLAPCNDRMFDLSVQMAESEDPVTAMLSQAMSEHMAGGLGIALIAKIESVRYATEAGSSAALSTYLIEVGEGLASIADPGELELAVNYLDAIVQDPIVDETARSMGLLVLSEHAPWEALLASATGALRAGTPEELQAIALASLVERAGSDGSRRARVITLLEGVTGHERAVGRQLHLNEYIEILSQ